MGQRLRAGLDALVLAAPFDPREQEQVRDDRVEAVHLAEHDAQKALRAGLVREAVFQQRLDETLDRGDRRPQLVGDVGHEVAADVLQVPQPRHVVHYDQHADLLPAGVVQRRAVGVQPTFARAEEAEVAVQRRRTGLEVLDELQQVRLAEHFIDASPADQVRLDAQQPGARSVHAQHGAREIDGHHAFFHAGEHGLVLALLPQDALNAIVEHGGHRVERFGQHADFLHGIVGQAILPVAAGEAFGAAADSLQGADQRPRGQNRAGSRREHGQQADRGDLAVDGPLGGGQRRRGQRGPHDCHDPVLLFQRHG